jgi:Trk-type K+ transport system membrane component
MNIETLGIALLIAGAIAYPCYVFALIVRADFYSYNQKIVQTILLMSVPVIGAAIVHWFHMLHRAQPEHADRAFIPQREPEIDEYRSLTRHRDET